MKDEISRRQQSDDLTVPEARFMVLAMCESLEIIAPITGDKISKIDFGIIIAIIDSIVILTLVIFTWAFEIG